MTPPLTGGCQCGAVRFACDEVGRASICHCRMCQKAFGGFFGPLVDAIGMRWTRGAPTYFRSSNVAKRGFCGRCGTPLTFEIDGVATTEMAIGAFDQPEALRPVIQFAVERRMPWFADLTGLPEKSDGEAALFADHYARVVSFQHPDHDTPEPDTAERDPR